MGKWLVVSPEGIPEIRTEEPILTTLHAVVQGELEALQTPLIGTTACGHMKPGVEITEEALPRYPQATAWLQTTLWQGARVVGNLVVVGVVDDDGAVVDLTDEQVEQLWARFA